MSIDIFVFDEFFINFKCIIICLNTNCKKIFLDSSIEFIDTGNENLIPNYFLLPTQIVFIKFTNDMNQINDNINSQLI